MMKIDCIRNKMPRKLLELEFRNQETLHLKIKIGSKSFSGSQKARYKYLDSEFPSTFFVFVQGLHNSVRFNYV